MEGSRIAFSQHVSRGGFTLLENVVTLGIMAILSLAIFSAIPKQTGATAANQGAMIAADLFTMARSEAIRTGGNSILLVDAYQDNTNPSAYLHRLMIADVTSTTIVNGNTTVIANSASAWYILPPGIYFYPKYSLSSTTSVTINGTSSQFFPNVASGQTSAPGYVYTFTSTGQLSTAGQFVVAQGIQTSPLSALPTFVDATRHGLYLHLLGRPSFYPNTSTIQAVP